MNVVLRPTLVPTGVALFPFELFPGPACRVRCSSPTTIQPRSATNSLGTCKAQCSLFSCRMLRSRYSIAIPACCWLEARQACGLTACLSGVRFTVLMLYIDTHGQCSQASNMSAFLVLVHSVMYNTEGICCMENPRAGARRWCPNHELCR